MPAHDIIEQTKQLIAIPSTADNLAALQQVLDLAVDMIRQHKNGKHITIEQFISNGRPSILAYKRGSRPANFRILLNGHLDVVPGKAHQYRAEVRDGKIYGRGVYDMKAACVVLLNVFCDFVTKVPYELGLQLTTDEENAGQDGTNYQIQQGVRADFVICGECGRSTTAHEIANEAKGIAAIDVGFRGDHGHSAYPWRVENPAVKAMQFAAALHEYYPAPVEESHETTATITNMSANSGAPNKIANGAVIGLDMRYIAGDPHFKDKASLEAHLRSFHPEAEIVTWFDFSSPVYTRPDDPLLLKLKAAAEKIEGAPFSLARRHATSDARFYGDIGRSACEFGIAGEHQHGDQEYITLEALYNYLETMRAFLESTNPLVSRAPTVVQAVDTDVAFV